ncbi:sigma factor [Bengtsoniella intestinalis]|uniref:RNA polymerase sigma factor n=1 Tax=Bengtsoniella intestinalis TaxID=3073143 RepID=UPI00391F769F
MRLPIETIITQYQQNLYAVALNICKSPQDGEDVVQDTLLAYLSTHKDFETAEHIRAWLLRVAINKAKNKTQCH